MESWVYTVFLILIQKTVQSVTVEDTSSNFLIVAKPQENYQKEQLLYKNDLHHPTFNSNRSHPRIRSKPTYPISPPTIQGINLLGVEKSEENVRKGGILKSPSVEITPAHSQYLGYTIESLIQESPSPSKSSKKLSMKKDQSVIRSTTKKHPQTRPTSVKHTHVKVSDIQKTTPLYAPLEHEAINQKFTKVENTIHRPKTNDQVELEKPIHEYFSSDLTDLIEKAHHLDQKKAVGSTRKLRNSEDDSLGYRSDKYEVQQYLDHQPYVESGDEYHVYSHGDNSFKEKKKKKEVHYHQHKHLHEHDHDQKHSHKHQSGHHHGHDHEHQQKHAHTHGHVDDHWHEHHEKGEHNHESHHHHDHHGSHGHKHHEDHDHKHDSGHHHGHEDHHDHHEDHKNWHGHKHHGDHDHHHDHEHRHKGKHGHEHKHGHKHKHNHHQKHGGKH